MVLLLCLSSFAQAQQTFGIKGGLNFPNLGGLPNESMDLVAFHAGLFHNIHFGKASRGRAQFELLYSAQGADLRDDHQEIRLNYLSLPIALQLGLGRSDRPFLYGIYLEGGMAVGQLVSSKIKLLDPATGTQETIDLQEYYTTRNPDVKVKRTDVSLLGGIGYNIGFSYQVSLRYLYGLSPAVTDQGAFNFSNRVLQLSMAIGF